jgi:hypothetical protein
MLHPLLLQLTALLTTQVRVDYNQLSALPPALLQLRGLELLSARSNLITALHPALANLRCLLELDLDDNPLQAASPALVPLLCKLANLIQLGLANTGMTAVQGAALRSALRLDVLRIGGAYCCSTVGADTAHYSGASNGGIEGKQQQQQQQQRATSPQRSVTALPRRSSAEEYKQGALAAARGHTASGSSTYSSSRGHSASVAWSGGVDLRALLRARVVGSSSALGNSRAAGLSSSRAVTAARSQRGEQGLTGTSSMISNSSSSGSRPMTSPAVMG